MNPAVPTRIVKTRYLGPTEHRGSRVTATNVNTGRKVTVVWDDSYDPLENHECAARYLLAPLRSLQYEGQLLVSSVSGGGYIFAAAPEVDAAE
jgi:hypothetical protein